MKKNKSTDVATTIFVAGILTFVIGGIGVMFGRENAEKALSDDDNISFDEYLEEYIEERSALEKEIDTLMKQKEALENSKTFDVDDLIVIEHTNVDSESNLFILSSSYGDGIYREYHDDFKAWYKLHEPTNEHTFDFCCEYVHFDEGQPLFYYLNDEEITKISRNGGKTTTSDLDLILGRIRREYQEQLSEDKSLQKIANN